MSNFLQRIAASAVHGASSAGPRLHPMLGSIYAPATPQAIGSGSIAAPETYLESVSRPSAAANPSRAELLFPPVHGNEPYSSSSVPRQSSVPQSNIPVSPGRHGGELFAASEIEGPQHKEVKTARREREAAAQADKAHRSEETKSNFDERTDMRHVQQSAAPTAIGVQSLRTAAPPRVDPDRRTSASRSDPDEIHIHIGKIEVAAVAPPPPRAAAASPRKGINLDEYLRGGSGRRR